MGVFGKSKKAKEAQAEGPMRTDTLPAPSKMSRSLKRKQKTTPEPEPVMIPLSLPDNKDFRTSLILPGLSARFSMLREQNDPNTKIGKANDDSVLFPSRASRLNLFQHNPLTDIAEVESIYSFRPPFAGNERSNSISSSYASDDGSMMNRTKPAEGNNLFSGRQKIYRVPQGTSSNSTLSEGRALGGRHVYSNDVTAAMFRSTSGTDHRSAEDLNNFSPENIGAEPEETEHTTSPSTPFSKNRGTTSSTTSAPSNGRTSTAATSIASESPAIRDYTNTVAQPISRDHSNGSSERVNSQKRAYGQTFDYNTPHLPPVNDIAGPPASRVQSGPKHSHKLSQSRSMITLKELHVPQQNVFTSSNLRSPSPPLTAPLAGPLRSHKDAAAREDGRSPSPLYRAISPTAGMAEPDGLLTYNNNVQPGDRGKATALGLFNKPQRQFDEQQYSQRQMQMHEGRTSPPNRTASAEGQSRVASPEPVMMFQPDSVEARQSPVEQLDRSSQPPGAWPIVSSRPRTKSSASTAKSALIEARTNSLIRRQNEELANLENQRNFSAPIPAERRRGSQKSQKSIAKSPMITGTFFDALGGSEDESETASPSRDRQTTQSRQPPKDVHPALRDGLNEFIFDDSFASPKLSAPRSPFQKSRFSDNQPSMSREQDLPPPIPSPSDDAAEDSPTLPAPGLGLSGLVRSHMRTDSDKSSLYPPAADVPNSGSEAVRKVSTSTERTVNPPESIRSDPWELDNEAIHSDSPVEGTVSQNQTAFMSQKARQILGQARALNNQSRSKAQQILGEDAPDAEVPAFDENHPLAPWLDDKRPSHRRESSSLTQKEDQELEDEMAERRRRIQQRLGGVVDSEGRSMSPAPGFGRSPNKAPYIPSHPLPDQRGKQPGPDGPYDQRAPKAMKMLGIQDPPPRRRASPRIPHDDLWKDEEEQMLRDYGRKPKPRSMPVDDEYTRGGDRPGHPAGMRSGSAEEIERSRQRSATPNSGTRGPSRPRPNPEYGNRSRSRNGHNREDDERMYGRSYESGGRTHGNSRSPHEDPYNRGPSRGPGDRSQSRGPNDRAPSRGAGDPRNYDRSTSASSGRYRSNSRPGAPPHMDNRPPPIMPPANGNMPFRPPRPAPPPIMGQDGPMSPHPPQRPFDASSSPPSGTNSPTVATHGMASNGRTTPTSSGQSTATRKKSVTKNMISEPTFLSSTSSVPLVGLDDATSSLANFDIATDGTSPPIPIMNPRRRRQTDTNNPSSEPTSASGLPPHNSLQYLRPGLRPNGMTNVSSPLPISPIGGKYGAFSGGDEHTLSDDNAIRAPRQRNRLRKTSSEGGSMAAKARNHAMLGELRNERVRSPAVPTFGNQTQGMGMGMGPVPVRMGHGPMGGVGGGMAAGSRIEAERPVGRGVREGEMF